MGSYIDQYKIKKAEMRQKALEKKIRKTLNAKSKNKL